MDARSKIGQAPAPCFSFLDRRWRAWRSSPSCGQPVGERASGVPWGRSGPPGLSGMDNTGLVEGLLFDGEEREKQIRVDAVVGQIKERLGARVLRRRSGLRGENPRTL